MGRLGKAVLPFISPVASAIVGARDQRKAERRGRAEAEQNMQQQRNAQAQNRAETERLNKQIQSSQERIGATQARTSRRRIRGGLFGLREEGQAQSQGALNPRLG